MDLFFFQRLLAAYLRVGQQVERLYHMKFACRLPGNLNLNRKFLPPTPTLNIISKESLMQRNIFFYLVLVYFTLIHHPPRLPPCQCFCFCVVVSSCVCVFQTRLGEERQMCVTCPRQARLRLKPRSDTGNNPPCRRETCDHQLF